MHKIVDNKYIGCLISWQTRNMHVRGRVEKIKSCKNELEKFCCFVFFYENYSTGHAIMRVVHDSSARTH